VPNVELMILSWSLYGVVLIANNTEYDFKWWKWEGSRC